jgi:Outer membrane protein beta-barrel domain
MERLSGMRMVKAVLVLGGLCAVSANAQGISLGVLGGAPFTDVVSSVNQNNLSILPQSTNFVVGPSFRVNLPLNLRVEVDALYRPYSFSVAGISPSGLSNSTVSANQWRFPFLLQYRINTPIPLLKPFVEAGASFDHLANISSAANNITSGPGTLLRESSGSFVLGGGIDVKIPFIRISGELRYSHQGSANFESISNQNQAEVLVGVHF